MGGLCGSSTPDTQVVRQTNEPPAFAVPFFNEAFGAASRRFTGQGSRFFPQSTVVPFSNETEEGLQGILGRARAGSPVNRAANTQALDTFGGKFFDNPANKFLEGTARGDFLSPDSNPFLRGVFEQIADRTQGRVNSAFGNMGRRGGGANQEILAREISQLGERIFADNFQQERGRQLQASQALQSAFQNERGNQVRSLFFAPQLANQDFADSQQILGVGGAREDLAGRQIEDAISRFNFAEFKPDEDINRFIAQLAGVPGGTQTTTQPIFQNRALTGLGSALGFGSLGSTLGLGTGGSLGLAGLGGLLGLFL